MRVLLDTTVWIDHLSGRTDRIGPYLKRDDIVIHQWIIGELALGNLGPRRQTIIGFLDRIARVRRATDLEVLGMIEAHQLGGTGIGWVDAHILASARLTPGVTLLTRDRRLQALRARAAFATTIGVWDYA